jgi:Zn-dependent alcohol dehydrogenases, class III
MTDFNAAVVREKGGRFAIETVTLEEPRPHEVLVRIAGVGMCHTDLVVRDQYFPTPLPAVLGHEGSGVVEAVGVHVSKVQPGDHVVLSYASDGTCQNCQEGQLGYCPDLYGRNFTGRRPDGTTPMTDSDGSELSAYFFAQSSFGDYALATEANVVKIDKDVPLEIMGPLGCGIQTGAGAVMNALKPKAGDTIAVFGVGSVGMSAVMAAAAVGCTKIIAIDVVESRLTLAADLGATHVINAKTANPVEKIVEITGDGAQFALECTGIPEVVRQSVECLRLTGVAGTMGVAPLGTEITLDMASILFGRTLRGIIEGDSIPDIFIPRLVELWKQGRFPFDKLIQKYPLSEIDKAAHDSEEGAVLKAVLIP